MTSLEEFNRLPSKRRNAVAIYSGPGPDWTTNSVNPALQNPIELTILPGLAASASRD